MKPTILMLPSWYPVNGSLSGSFFREQALALLENFSIVVLLYTEKSIPAPLYFFRKILGLNKPKIFYNGNDCGIEEYSGIFFIPKYYISNLILSKLRMKVAKNLQEGVGVIEAPSITKARQLSVSYLRNANYLPKINCIWGQTAQDTASISQVFSQIFDIPYVVEEHGYFPWPGVVISDVTASAIENANLFFTISHDKTRQILAQGLKINPWYVGNLVDDDLYVIHNDKKEPKTFLIVAAHSNYKNYDMFIKTMEFLKQIAKRSFRILIVGYNPRKGHGKNAELLENKIRNSIFADVAELIPSVSREDMPSIYARADAFVMTSIQEGMPVSALEAAMSGLPIFSTRCGGVEDYVDEKIGKIVSLLDYKALAHACNDFLNGAVSYDPVYIRERVRSRFGKKAFIQNMSDAFFSVINNDSY